jgi:hypothetical protein
MTLLARRRWLLASLNASVGIGVLPSLVFGKEEPLPPDVDRAGAELITKEAQRAIRRGIDFLAGRQIRTGRAEGSFGLQRYASGVAVCSLAGLAFMAAGSAPKEGPQGHAIDRCIKFILASVQEGGFISGGASNDQMYGHGLATLFLAQVYGMTLRDDVGPKLRAAVKLICECQNKDGGWRYQPVKSDADLSITICQIMALRAARDAGLHVPIEVRDQCMAYVQRCQNSDGSYRYTLNGGRTTVALTAAGIVSLYSAGIYEGPEVERRSPGSRQIRRAKGAAVWAAIISMASTMPRKRCGNSAASAGRDGTSPFATSSSPTKPLAGRGPMRVSAPSLARRLG